MFHVGLIDADSGSILYHEQLPNEQDARLRHTMLCLQGELDLRDLGKSEAAVFLDTWPPPGQEEIEIEGKLHLRAMAPVEPAPTEAQQEKE